MTNFSKIYFRALTDYSGGDIKAKNPNAKHTSRNIIKHIENGGVAEGDPYISLTSDIAVAMYKFSYGLHRNEHRTYCYNATRGKIVLINAESFTEPSVEDAPPSSKDVLYTMEAIEDNKNNVRYGTCDREAIVYGSISKKNIHEIHPFLVDLLVALENISTNGQGDKSKLAQKVYEGLIDGVIKGKLSVEKITKSIKKMLDSADKDDCSIKSISTFVDEFYNKRNNIADTFKVVFENDKRFRTLLGNNFDSKISTEEMMNIGTALRVHVLKRLFNSYVKHDKKYGILVGLLDDYAMPIEEHVHTSALENDSIHYMPKLKDNIRLNAKNNEPVKMLAGMHFSRDSIFYAFRNAIKVRSQDKILNLSEVCYEDIRNTEYTKKYGTKKLSDFFKNDLSNPEVRKNKRNYITSRKKPIIKYKDNKEVAYVFDENGNCIRFRIKDQKYHFDDYCRDKDGNPSKLDDLGYDERGFHKTAIDRFTRIGYPIEYVPQRGSSLSIPGDFSFKNLDKNCQTQLISTIIDSALETMKTDFYQDRVRFYTSIFAKIFCYQINHRDGSFSFIDKDKFSVKGIIDLFKGSNNIVRSGQKLVENAFRDYNASSEDMQKLFNTRIKVVSERMRNNTRNMKQRIDFAKQELIGEGMPDFDI